MTASYKDKKTSMDFPSRSLFIREDSASHFSGIIQDIITTQKKK